ncbi:hypothetical protein Dsin_024679 [Dipteronia sinensis]|uniref:Putative plant transposon protein domain-containing protein n=1 Tax=Dipteronia sinensis TaxID=43782 RepID=A0AAE0DXL9_9ROSI|nr:hypothetical protein Dsin_024679 [Dipteronia sinensis]
MNVRGKTFRVSSDSINKFLGHSSKIVSKFLNVNNIEHLDLIGRTLCDDNGFEWGKRAFISQSELTKVSAFWHLFICANLVGSTNASELNKEKIKFVYVLVTNKPLHLLTYSSKCTQHFELFFPFLPPTRIPLFETFPFLMELEFSKVYGPESLPSPLNPH